MRMRPFAGYSGLYRLGPLTHLKMYVFFSALHCLSRGGSLKVHKLGYFTAKWKSMSGLHIFLSAVHCSCQHSEPCRVCARLISQLKCINTLFIYYSIIIWNEPSEECKKLWRTEQTYTFGTRVSGQTTRVYVSGIYPRIRWSVLGRPCGIRNAQNDREATELHVPKLHNYLWLLLRCAMVPTSQDVITSPVLFGASFPNRNLVTFNCLLMGLLYPLPISL